MNQRKNLLRWIAAGAVVATLTGVGLLRLRQETDGLRNAFSAHYWSERSRGEDLYSDRVAMFKRGPRSLSDICLTIDDGPHPTSANRILDVLKREHVPATFFVVGVRVKEHPEIVRRMLAEGHEVGNHTQDHFRIDKLTATQVRNELENCEINVERATGRRMRLMRPPGMRYNEQDLEIAKSMGYTTIGWNVGAKDYTAAVVAGKLRPHETEKIEDTPTVIAQRVLKQVRNGSIILLHDTPTTAAALPTIIETLRREGYHFRSTAEMLDELPNPVMLAANPPAHIGRLVLHRRPAPWLYGMM